MAALDKSLDDIISEKRIQASRGNGSGPRSGDRGSLRDPPPRRDRFPQDMGPIRRDNLSRIPSAPYQRRIEVDQFEGRPVRNTAAPVEARVRVEGLDPMWEARDVREIFTEQGHDVLKVIMHWDRAGRSEGSCELVMASMSHARALVDDMDGAEVDGFPLAISVVRSAQGPARGAAPSAGPSFGTRREPVREFGRDTFRDSGRDTFRDSGRDTFRDSGRPMSRDFGRDDLRDSPFGGGKGRGGKGRDRVVVSKEELDAELDRFRR